MYGGHCLPAVVTVTYAAYMVVVLSAKSVLGFFNKYLPFNGCCKIQEDFIAVFCKIMRFLAKCVLL